jgi:hypothetical protein
MSEKSGDGSRATANGADRQGVDSNARVELDRRPEIKQAGILWMPACAMFGAG